MLATLSRFVVLARVGVLVVLLAAPACHHADDQVAPVEPDGGCSVRTGSPTEVAACGDYAVIGGTLADGCYAASKPPSGCDSTYWSCVCEWAADGMAWQCRQVSCSQDGGTDAAADGPADAGAAAGDDGPTDAGTD